jgi:hypothetical protein
MGANGSFAKGSTESDAGRNWNTIYTIGKIQIIQKKDPKSSIKLPEESHTPNRTYAIFKKDGSDVKGIAKYGPDGKKIWEIHTSDHDDFAEHYHKWMDGHPMQYFDAKRGKRNIAFSLTDEMINLLKMVRQNGN